MFGKYGRKLAALAVVPATLGFVALGAGAADASTAPHAVHHMSQIKAVANGISTTALDTPNVAGYYAFNGAAANYSPFNQAGATLALSAVTANATYADGTQICDNSSGWTVGEGVINNGNGTFTVDWGMGQQPYATDGNPCLDGVLPTQNVHALTAQLDSVPSTDSLHFNIQLGRKYFANKGGHGRHAVVSVEFSAEDLTTGTNVWQQGESLPKGVNPNFNQVGTGTQEPQACTTTEAANTDVADFSNVEGNHFGYGAGFASTAVQVNALPSSASVAALSPENSLTIHTFWPYDLFSIDTTGVDC